MTCFTAALLLALILPGALGLLRPVAMLVVALAEAAVAWHYRTVGRARASATTPGLIAALALLALAGCAIALVRDVAGAPISSIDAQNFQVPIPARWIQNHSLWGLHQFIPDYSNATYPHTGNLLLAAVMLPFHSPFLARLVAVPYWALAGVAVYAIASELRAPRTAAILAGCAFCALPVSMRAGLEGAQTDMPMLACFGAGVLFLLQGRHPLAGLALGLAFGTKWYALTTVAIVLLLFLIARRRTAVRDGALMIGLVAAAGGFWLVRNWVETGDPLFPQPLRPLFDAPPDPLRAKGGFSLAHYAFDWDVWRTYLGPAFKLSFGWDGAVLALCAIAAAVIAARRRDRRVLLVAIGAVLLAGAYALTPYSAFGPEGKPVLAAASTRYGLPALLAIAVLAAWLVGRAGRWRTALEVVLALAVLDGLRRGFDLPAGKVAFGVVAALLLYLAWTRVPRRALAVAAVAAAVIGVLIAAHRANTQSYAPLDPTLAYIEQHAPSGHRIALAGIWSPDGVSPVLPAFGKRLDNAVVFDGPFVDGMLRAHRDPQAFVRGLGGFDLLLAGTGTPPGSDTTQLDWARAAGWRPVAESPRLVLLARPAR